MAQTGLLDPVRRGIGSRSPRALPAAGRAVPTLAHGRVRETRKPLPPDAADLRKHLRKREVNDE